MEIFTDNKLFRESVVDANPDIKFGKLICNHNKMNHLNSLHEGNKSCIDALREAGCTKIILEFNDLSKAIGFEKIKINSRLLRDQSHLEETMENWGVDYVLLCPTDVNSKNIPKEILKTVHDRVVAEKYVERLQLAEWQTRFLYEILVGMTLRNTPNIYFCRGLKCSRYVIAAKHYGDKYDIYRNRFLIIPEVYTEKGVIVKAKGTPTPDEVSEFALYFHGLSDAELLSDGAKITLESKAESFGEKLNYLEIVDADLIGEGNKCLTLTFNTPIGGTITINRIVRK